MAKLTKILVLTLFLNIISLQLLTICGKEEPEKSENPATPPTQPADVSEKPAVKSNKSDRTPIKTAQKPQKATVPTNMENEQPGQSNTNPVNSSDKLDKEVGQPVKTNTDRVDGGKQVRTNLELEESEIGLYNFRYKLKAGKDSTLPDLCTACVILRQNSETCCEKSSSDASKINCLEKKFDKLSAGTEYKLNICDSGKTEIFSHEFETKNIPRLKESTFNDNAKTFTCKLEYVKSDNMPEKCIAMTDDRNILTCQDGTTCSCKTGTYRLSDTSKEQAITIADTFNGVLYHFNKDGPMPDDPSFYNFKVSNKKANSVAYSMSQYDPDINGNKICKFKNLAGNALLKCQSKEGDNSSNNCICTGGNLVELSPFSKYNVEISNDENKVIYHRISFKTARVPRKLEQIIGIKKYKYTMKDITGVDKLPEQCKVCIFPSTSIKKCCKDVSTHTGAEICRTREFSEEDIEKASGESLKINICDKQGNQIATDSFSMPIKFETAKFIQTINGFQYNLSFKDDKKPTICNLEIESKSTNQKIDHRCIDQGSSKCDCSSGEILLTPNLPGQITIIVKDYFDEKIVEESFTLKDSDKIHTTDPATNPVGGDKKTVQIPEDKTSVDSSSLGIKEDSAGTENSGSSTEEVEEKEEEEAAAPAEKKEPTEANNANPAGGPAPSVEDSTKAGGQPAEEENNEGKKASLPTLGSSNTENGAGGADSGDAHVAKEKDEGSQEEEKSSPKDSQASNGGPAASTEDSTKVDVVKGQPAEGENNEVRESSPPTLGSGNTENGAVGSDSDVPVATEEGSPEGGDKSVTLPTTPAVIVAPEEKEGAVKVSVEDEDEEEEEVVENAGTGIEKPITVSTDTGVNSETVDVGVKTGLPGTPSVVDSVDDDDDDDDEGDGGSDIADKDGKPVTTTEDAMKVAKEAKKIAEEAKASANEAKKEVEGLIESEENSSPDLIIPILTDGIDASAATPVNTDDGQGSNGSNLGGNDSIVIAPQPPIISNPNGGGITTGEGGEKPVNTTNNGVSANGSTNDRNIDNVSSTGGNHVPAVKPTTTANIDAPNPATNTTTTTVPNSEDVKKPGSDGGDINDQGLSSGAIIGIIVGVMVLAGSVGGISYYMIRIKGRASYV